MPNVAQHGNAAHYALAASTLLLLLLLSPTPSRTTAYAFTAHGRPSLPAYVPHHHHHHAVPPVRPPTTRTTLHLSSEPPPPPPTPLCDLQTFLRMTDQVQSGGDAKTKIQAGLCLLNDAVETRRAKKLFPGDVVSLRVDGSGGTERMDVAVEVAKRGYVYRVKEKKVRPEARIIDGEKEFGGRFRTDEWRKERKEKKEGRKMRNKRDLLE